MLYRIKRVHVEAGGTAEMVITYPHESSELYYLAIPDDMSSFTSGSVSSGIAAGKILKTGEQRYSFKGAYVGGYTVFIGRKSQIKTTASQKPGAAFPLASILQVLSELSRISEEHSEETERSMRSPEAEGKMILPTAELRAGLILGFDEHGNPVVGKQIPQVADILTQEIRVEEHVLRAQDAAAQAKNSEKLAQLFADDAGNSKKEAETWAEEAAKHSGDAQSVIGDVRSEGANALNALGSEKDKALSEISGKAITAVEQAQKAAADAQEDREAVEQMYNAAAGSNEELQKALCFMACAVKHTGEAQTASKQSEAQAKTSELAAASSAELAEEYAARVVNVYKYKGTVEYAEDLPTEGVYNGDVYNVSSTGENYAWVEAEQKWDVLGGASKWISREAMPVPGLTGNANFYGYLGTFANLGSKGGDIVPKTISFYRRSSNGTVDSSVPRYVRVLRKDADGAWYVAYQSSNGLAPTQFTQIGMEMKWFMAEVAGGAIPSDEPVAIIQTDNPDSENTHYVMFGARSTTDYAGGTSQQSFDLDNVLAVSPGIKADYVVMSPFATQGDLKSYAKLTDLPGAATVNVAGLVKLGTDTVLNTSNATPVQLNENGQMVLRHATQGQYGAVVGSGKGVWIDNGGRVQLALRANHSGVAFSGNDMYVQTAEQSQHPTAGTVAPTATDTSGKIVVLDATTSLPGGVKLASGVDDTGDVAVLTAAQIKTLLAGKMNMADAVSLTLSIQQLEARVAALEGATTA